MRSIYSWKSARPCLPLSVSWNPSRGTQGLLDLPSTSQLDLCSPVPHLVPLLRTPGPISQPSASPTASPLFTQPICTHATGLLLTISPTPGFSASLKRHRSHLSGPRPTCSGSSLLPPLSSGSFTSLRNWVMPGGKLTLAVVPPRGTPAGPFATTLGVTSPLVTKRPSALDPLHKEASSLAC